MCKSPAGAGGVSIAILKARIARAEDRAARATTTEDYLMDMWIIQEATAQLRKY